MLLLVDPSALARPSRPREGYCRELLRRLLLCSEGLELALLAWPRRLGDPTRFLEPLPRGARARVRAELPDWELARALAAGDAILYSPLGVPLAPARLRGAMQTCPRVATAPFRPLRGMERCERVVAWTRLCAERALAGGVFPEQLRWIPAALDGAELPARRQRETISVPRGPYVAMSWPSSQAAASSWVEAARQLACCRRALRDRRLSAARLVVLGAPRWVRRAAGWLATSPKIDLRGPLADFEHERVVGSAQAFLHTGDGPEAHLETALALRLGVPVLAPFRPDLVETLSDAARYYAPGTSDGLARELTELFADDDLRRGLAQKGISRARAFSWEAAARQLLDLLSELVAETRGRSPPAPFAAPEESWQPALARR